MVLAIAQNNGAGAARLYLGNNGEWDKVYDERKADWDQLGIILKNVLYLWNAGLYSSSRNVDFNRWERIFNSKGVAD